MSEKRKAYILLTLFSIAFFMIIPLAPYISVYWIIFDFLNAQGMDFIIVDKNFHLDYKNLTPTVNFCSRYFKLVRKMGNWYFYQLSYDKQ